MEKLQQISRRKFVKTSMLLGASLPVLGMFDAERGNGKTLLRIGLMTDSHYADRPNRNERHYKDSLIKMQECVKALNAEIADIAVHLGDFKDQDEQPDEAKTLQYLKRLETAYGGFKGDRYHVLGNHDMDSLSKDQFLSNITNTGIPKDRSYYAVRKNGLRIIVLDGCFTQKGVSYDHDNFKWNDSIIPVGQLEWLKSELHRESLPTIVCIHQQLLGMQTHMVLNADKVRNILADSKQVLAVFQGHSHVEQVVTEKGIHYCTLPAMSDGKGLDNNAFAIASVQRNGDITLKGFKKVSDQKLEKGS